MKRKLPANLFAAYDWTASASELDELRTLAANVGSALSRSVRARAERALEKYVRQSAANWAQSLSGHVPVEQEDLIMLGSWLAKEVL